MTAVKTSRKNIERMWGIKAQETDIRSYDNLIYYLTGGKIEKDAVERGCISKKSLELISELKEKIGYRYAQYQPILYASGIDGVIGRYDLIVLYDENLNKLGSFNLKFVN